MNTCAFTICSKNYLAQAITLKESFVKNNENCPFFIFLADRPSQEVQSLDLVLLDESWIPKWKEMAFKYGVIEFNTSIKPFCINKLFKDGFQKVVYLDPDIYVVRPLEVIYSYLDDYDCVLSPHFCYLQQQFQGAVSETQISSQGLYNLGFGAFKNSNVGRKIINWWMDRLETNCYGDTLNGMFVDQKWMDFIPLFYPDNVLVTKNAGINTAIWNLHERTLMIENGEYLIKDIIGDVYPLLFYHFSGFDPYVPKVINRRHPQFNTDVFPSFIPLIDEYRKRVIDNGYDKYRILTYGFSCFENGYKIIVMQRRFLKEYVSTHSNYLGNPFSEQDEFYKILEKNKCIYKVKDNHPGTSKETIKYGEKMEAKYIRPILFLLKKFIGIGKYYLFIRMANKIGKTEYHNFLINNK